MLMQKMKIQRHLMQLLVLILIFVSVSAAQVTGPGRFSADQPALMDSLNNQLNFYDFAANPAGLYADERAKSLWVGNNTQYAEGNYHHPFSPELQNDQHYFTRTIYPLSENDLFKGYFAYRRRKDGSVLWAHQSRNVGKMPFMLADSSRGDFTLNGLYWGAEWAHRFNPDFYGGISFAYNVDQRLKEIFPKPLNKHRDIYLNVGLQYNLKDVKLGLNYRYIDEQEKVDIRKYNLDQDLTPLLYKFRYSDLPVILRGKTSEERQIDLQGHQAGLQFSYQWYNWAILTNAGYRTDEGKVVDGGSRKDEQGMLNSDQWFARMLLQYQHKGFTGYVNYAFEDIDLLAKHPMFDLTILKLLALHHRLVFGGKLPLINQLNIYGDIVYDYYWESRHDLVTENFWQFRRQSLGVILGMNYWISSRWETMIWLGYSKLNIDDVQRSDNPYSGYHGILYEAPLDYYISPDTESLAGLKVIYHYIPVMDIELTGRYLNQNAILNHRDNWLVSLCVKLYVF